MWVLHEDYSNLEVKLQSNSFSIATEITAAKISHCEFEAVPHQSVW